MKCRFKNQTESEFSNIFIRLRPTVKLLILRHFKLRAEEERKNFTSKEKEEPASWVDRKENPAAGASSDHPAAGTKGHK